MCVFTYQSLIHVNFVPVLPEYQHWPMNYTIAVVDSLTPPWRIRADNGKVGMRNNSLLDIYFNSTKLLAIHSRYKKNH